MPNFQGVWSLAEQYQNRVAYGPPAPIGFFVVNSVIDKINIETTGNATSFGGPFTSDYNAGCSSSTRMLIGREDIGYVEFATGGEQSTFGALDPTYAREVGALSSQTRGVFFGGLIGASQAQTNQIKYVTIATTGDALDFGDISGQAGNGVAGCSQVHGGIS